MKTLIIYTSQTGFTEKYAGWLAKRLNADILQLQAAKKKKDDFFLNYDSIIYGGWAIAGKISKANWFLDKSVNWHDKKLVIFCVGGSPRENPDVDVFLENYLSTEQKQYIKLFYCQGGIDYSRMNLPSKMLMKAFVSTIRKNKNASEQEKEMAKWLDHSYDISDEKYIEPIVQYLE